MSDSKLRSRRSQDAGISLREWDLRRGFSTGRTAKDVFESGQEISTCLACCNRPFLEVGQFDETRVCEVQRWPVHVAVTALLHDSAWTIGLPESSSGHFDHLDVVGQVPITYAPKRLKVAARQGDWFCGFGPDHKRAMSTPPTSINTPRRIFDFRFTSRSDSRSLPVVPH